MNRYRNRATEAEVAAALAAIVANDALDPYVALLARVVHAAALRPCEAAAATVGDLDLERHTLRVTDRRTGAVRFAPLSAALVRDLAKANAGQPADAPLLGPAMLSDGKPSAQRALAAFRRARADSAHLLDPQVAGEQRVSLHHLRLDALLGAARRAS